MKKSGIFVAGGFLLGLMLYWAPPTFAHCQIPCGIYNDEARFTLLAEDITTIEKSMNQITALSKEKSENMNQIVRWVRNKEDHAAKISKKVTYYFMAQRLKVPKKADKKAHAAYLRKLGLLHEMIIYAMKAKQTTDLAHVVKLRSLLEEFRDAYFGPKEKKHSEKEHKHPEGKKH